MKMTSLVVGPGAGPLGMALAAVAGLPLVATNVERFPDGELQVSLDSSVQGQRVVLLQALGAPVGERILELNLLADAVRRAGARQLVGAIPYLGYARHDRRSHELEPLGAHVVASLVSCCGFERVLCVDLHAPAIEGFFSCPVENLTAEPRLAEALRPLARGAVIVAPDLGAVKLAQRYAQRLDLPLAIVHKTRLSGREVVASHVVGDVKGRRPIIVDDMISTGATIAAAFDAVVAAGAAPEAIVVATHGVFAPGCEKILAARPIQRLFVTDSVEPLVALSQLSLERVSLAPALTDAIRRLDGDRSLPQ